MNITLRQLRAFTEVARRESFTEAAKQLHLSQSAVSALIRELERQIGFGLLDRTTRRVVLSASGGHLLELSERVLQDVDSALSEAKSLLDKSRGRVIVAASPLSAVTILPAMISRFARTFPKVRIDLRDVLTDQILQSVRNGTVDIGIGTFEKSETELELSTLYEDVLGVIMPNNSPLASRRSLYWRDLKGQSMIALSRSSVFRPLIDSTLRAQSIELGETRFEVGYMGTAVALVEAGLGISVLPERAAALIKQRRARFRRLTAPVVSRPMTLVTRAGRSLSPAASAFVECLSEAGFDSARAPSSIRRLKGL
ncbi:MAG TPA: LysR family transcriptional regulator [Steroidobacteraceae bacterium]|nr:LysR family transcriptional regulator [Steroidobacteraceae bacterium]